ncbi:MAG: hypothetical protein JWO13_2869 [Acidobacteriales bacterium]|nr:hypothetical protein [Terriglobales bacterium]
MRLLKTSFMFALVFVLMLTANGTTIVPMSIERLTHASTHVLVAQAGDSWTQWNPEHTMIFTFTKFRVSRALKGQAANEVIVKQMGGRSGAYEQKVAGVRHWQSGDEAVLFVHPSQSPDGTLVVTGLMQGDFRMLPSANGKEKMVSNGVVGVEAFNPQQGTTEHFSGSRMPFTRLKSLVQDAMVHEVAK